MEAIFNLLLLWLAMMVDGSKFYPTALPLRVKQFRPVRPTAPMFRALLVDTSGDNVYVGAQGSIYKLQLSPRDRNLVLTKHRILPSIKEMKPNFKARSTDRKWWTTVKPGNPFEFENYPPIRDIIKEFEPNANIDTYNSVNLKNKLDNYLHDIPFGSVTDLEGNAVMETVEQYSTIYQSAHLSFAEHCQRQAEALSVYYGNDLQMDVAELKSLCDSHIRGMTFMEGDKLFSIRTGIFGTMPVSATGTNKYDNWLRYQGEIQPFLTCLFSDLQPTCRPTQPIRPPFSQDNYSGVITDPPKQSSAERLPVPDRNSYLMPSPENFLGKLRHCDNTPGPNRLILQSADLGIINDGVLVGQKEKESCSEGSLAQLFLGGYHPDQKTFTHFSAQGNGAGGGKKAVYIITEIGQEKQLDLMREYLNLPELYPLSSSASLAMVRLLVNAAGDVDPKSIVVSNPFKYTWVTSPLNRFGRLNKMGSQEQVSYMPKPVGLHEDADYMYFFFREADWENTPVPSYKIRRYHHNLNSYSHSLYFPWEKSFIDRSYVKKEEEPGNTYEELYAPDYNGWKYINDNLRVTGRVARVSKTDAGLPMGLQDANLFDLDHKLSLTTFQTFMKSRLTCRVPVAGVPFVWRLRRDTSPIANNSKDCFYEVRKAKNLYSKDVHYRSVDRDEFVTIQTELPSRNVPSKPVLKYFYLSHCKGYRWTYVPKPKTSSALYVEYTEFRDMFAIGDTFYGVFTLPFANEQLHTAKTGPNSSIKPSTGSAICSFSLSDIKSTFAGPFKKRDKLTGSYRPFGRKDTANIDPSPYSSKSDVDAVSKAETIRNMTIDFLDPSQPYSEEIRNIDLRKHSKRVNFFEEDVFGSRTMWNDVKTEPLLSENGQVFELVVAQDLGETTMIYVATSEGSIYKIANTRFKNSECRTTNGENYSKWLNNTKSMSSIWDNEFYAYLNRTVNKATFIATFKSDLTMEKDIKFPEDTLIRSDWDCTPSVKSTILAVLKPFGTKNTKIWDMKLTGSGLTASLVLATDEKVLQIPTIQCGLYTHCLTCSNDPQCLWKNSSCIISTDGSMTTDSTKCACQLIEKIADVGDDLILHGLDQPTDLSQLRWYRNDTEVQYRPRRVMLSHDTSLILFNILPSSSGRYELQHLETKECLARYQVTISNCKDETCRYEKKYQEWCNEYDDFFVKMRKWMVDYKNVGYCSNLPLN